MRFQNLDEILLPDSLQYIKLDAFIYTRMRCIIIPSSVKSLNYGLDRYGSKIYEKIVYVFLGKETNVSLGINEEFPASLVYCLPGSKVVKIAREHNIPMKPLSEFNLEDYNV